MKGFNLKIIIHILGLLLLFNAVFMGLVTLCSYFFDDGATTGLLTALAINVAAGGIFMGLTLNHRKEIKRERAILLSHWVGLPWCFWNVALCVYQQHDDYK